MTKVTLRLRVENNSKFVRGKGKVREEIERYVLSRFAMQKADQKGCEYLLSVPYTSDEELDRTIYEEICAEAERYADLRHCFIEADISSRTIRKKAGEAEGLSLSGSSDRRVTSLWPKNEGIVVVPHTRSATLASGFSVHRRRQAWTVERPIPSSSAVSRTPTSRLANKIIRARTAICCGQVSCRSSVSSCRRSRSVTGTGAARSRGIVKNQQNSRKLIDYNILLKSGIKISIARY